MTVFVTLAAGARADPDAAAEVPAKPKPNDYLLVFASAASRAGPYRFADSLLKGKPAAYAAAVTAFGAPSRLREEFLDKQEQSVGLCHIAWAQVGVKLTLFAWAGSWPEDYLNELPLPKIRPCAARELAKARFIEIKLFGPRWHNRTGVHVGAPLPPGPRLRILDVPEQVWAPDSPNHRAQMRLWPELDAGGDVTSIRVLISGYP